MFTGSIIWKGFIYSILMIIAKGLVSIVIYFEYFLKVWKEKLLRFRRRTKKTSSSRSGPEQIRFDSLPTPNPSQESTPDPELATGIPHSMALLVGLAMVARGEIGFLIASLSQSSGTLILKHRDETSTKYFGEEIFLVIVWAVVICTIVGPLGVGIIVRLMRTSPS